MAEPNYHFADLLKEAIYNIKKLEAKKISIIHDEIGYALGKKGGASVEHWRKGNLPVRWTELDQLARILVDRGHMKRSWLVSFLDHGHHPAAEALINELFPIPLPLENLESKVEREVAHTTPVPITFQLPIDKLPEAGNLPSGSKMPLSRNRFFVGRKQDLLALAGHFQGGHIAAVTQTHIAAAAGLGGVGKTQLASEFVHLYGQFFPGGVFWLSFEDPEAVPSQIAACGGASGMDLSPAYWDLPLKEQIRLVTQAWQSPTPRLLVFDNLEDETLLTEWMPTTGGCRVLVTSRRGEWDPVLGVETIPVGALYRHESIDLLTNLSGVADRQILDKIAAELGDLPLALHLAGKYLFRKRRIITPETYLAQLQNPELLNHPSFTQSQHVYSPTGHVQHVARTFALSYDQLDEQDKIDQIARALLVRAANFAPGEPIWYELLCKTIKPLVNEGMLEEIAEEGFTRLIDLGLVEFEEKEDIFRMHRLVAAFVRQFAHSAVQESLENVESIVFEELATINKAGYPVPLLSWNLHLRAVAEHAADRSSERSAWLLNSAGEHFRQMGDYQGAKAYFKRALDIWQATAGEDSELTAEGHMNYGKILRDLGQLDQAEPHLKKSLDCRLEILGEMHPKTAEAYNEYGRWLLRRKANHSSAQSYFEQAVNICKKSLGIQNAPSADYLNNLGMSLCYINEYEAALKHIKKGLNIRKKLFGKTNARTALSLNNMGYVLQKLERFNEAKHYYLNALEIRKLIYGDKHPDTAESLNNLGWLYKNSGNYTEAIEVLSEAIQIYEKVYGQFHEKLVHSLLNLGTAEFHNGRKNKSNQYLTRAYQICLELFDEHHALTQVVKQRMNQLSPIITT